jgi:hypothetical protein
MYLFFNANTDLQFQMIISYRRIWPHMPIFSSMLWLSSTNCYGSNGRAAEALFLPVLNQAIFADFRNIFLFKNLRHTKVKGKLCVKNVFKRIAYEISIF